MKKAFFLLSAVFFTGVAFSQQRVEADYVEIGVNENQAEKTVVKSVKFADGTTKNVQLKKRYFRKENLEAASSRATARTTDELLDLINSRREKDEFVKEMYEEDGVYYILFHKGDSKRRTPKISN